MVDEQRKSARKIRFSTVQIVALGFFGVIFLGGVLLWLPFSNRQPIAFIDALFTSVTAVCVTGLVTIVPAEQFTVAGKGGGFAPLSVQGAGLQSRTSRLFSYIEKTDHDESKNYDTAGVRTRHVVRYGEVYHTDHQGDVSC